MSKWLVDATVRQPGLPVAPFHFGLVARAGERTQLVFIYYKGRRLGFMA